MVVACGARSGLDTTAEALMTLLMAHQPMLCLHCENAPGAPVCPGQAARSQKRGLNQQAYNRCVGTRRCATRSAPGGSIGRSHSHDAPVWRGWC